MEIFLLMLSALLNLRFLCNCSWIQRFLESRLGTYLRLAPNFNGVEGGGKGGF